MEQLSRREFLVVFVVVEIECWRRQVLVSSDQPAVASVDPHVAIQITRLREPQHAELALVRLFAAANKKKISICGHEVKGRTRTCEFSSAL